MKAGDLVTIRDYSYSKEVKDGELQQVVYSHQQFIVVETDCKFPNPHQYQLGDRHFNNTVIQAVDSDKVVFIEERFLRPTTHKITIDGKTIEISQESYKALKKSLK